MSHLEPPEMPRQKQADLGYLEIELEGLYGFVDYHRGNQDNEKEILDLLQEAVREELPNSINEMLAIIQKMGWVDKVDNYVDYRRKEIIETANENWEP